ncbi:hypothetical protein VTN02DRAFT_5538 [Thermoascus thermophilus]
MGQGTMQYYSNRQLTADELLSAELSRETSGANLADGSSNGLHHGQSMVLGSNPGASEMGRTTSPEQQHNHMLQFTPNQQVGVDPNHDLSYGDQSARRKRSKVSRACDECRRKKVRCDATSEAGVETCSNCRRLGVACQFSRVPMKRGPSKGYIKELAERLNTLESQMQPSMSHADMQYQMNEVSSPRGYQEFSPPMDGSLLSRKRTFSMSEGFSSSAFPQPPFQHRTQPIGDSNILPDFLTGTMGNGTAAKNGVPFWSSGDTEHGLPAPADVPDVKPAAEDTTPGEIDEGALNAYYRVIHPILPILPNSKDRVLEILHQCSREVQEVFLHALYAVTGTNLSRLEKPFVKVLSFENAQELVMAQARVYYQIRSTATNLIWLQILLFMVLESDSRGPDNFRGKNGIPKGTLAELAGRLGFSLAKSLDQLRLGKRFENPDMDSDAGLARRGWNIACILCRWHAASVADLDPFSINEIAAAGDEKLLPESTMQLAKYSTILPTVLEMQAFEEDIAWTNHGHARVVKSVLYHQMERLRAFEYNRTSTPEYQANSVYFEAVGPQVFWTMELLMKRQLYLLSPYEVIHCAEMLVQEMSKTTNNPRVPSPFDIHSLALATMTLLESTDIPMYANLCWEAVGKIEQILDRRQEQASKGGEFENIFATPLWDARIRRVIEWKRSKAQAGQTTNVNANNAAANGPSTAAAAAPPVMGPNEQRSLQHLADLAVGAEGAVSTNASSPPATTTGPSGDANAVATSTTPAAPGPGQTNATPSNQPPQQQQQGPVFIDYTILSKKGYLNVIAGFAR